MAMIFWFLFALFAVAAQILFLPVSSTDQRVSATLIVGLLPMLTAVILSLIFYTFFNKICARVKSIKLNRIVCVLLVVLHTILMLAVVFSPLLYFAYTTRSEFNAYPTTHELPVEKVAADNTCNSPPVFALISDIHLTDKPRTLENKANSEGKLRQALSAIRNVCPKLLIVSGDLTDQGEQQEWEQFGALLQELHPTHSSRSVGPQVLFVPGNHDLQGTPYNQSGEFINKGVGRTQDEHIYAVPYLARKRRFLELAQTEGMITFMDMNSSMPVGFSRRVDDVLAAAAKKEHVMTDLGDDSGLGSDRTKPSYTFVYPKGFDNILEDAHKQFDDLFPMIHEDVYSGLTMVLLNSSTHLSPGASMGLGSLGTAQFKRLENYLSGLAASTRPVRSLIVVIHHAPFKRGTDAWSWHELRDKIGDSSIWAHTILALDVNDAKKIVSMLDDIARRRSDIQVILIHGHRHGLPYLGQTPSGVLVVEADGVIEDHPTGFWVAYQAGRKLALKWMSLGP